MKTRILLCLITLSVIVHQSCQAMDNPIKRNWSWDNQKPISPINTIDIQDNYGQTALIRACAYPNVDVEEVKRCLNQNADGNIRDKEGCGALHYICVKPAIISDADKILKLLLEKGFDPNIRDNKGETPLQKSCFYRSYEKVKLLLNYGANPDIQDNQGFDALQWAVVFGNNPMSIRIIKLLLNAGAYLFNRSAHGDTILHEICADDEAISIKEYYEAYLETLKTILLSRSPQEIITLINVRNRKNKTALMIAHEKGHKDVVDFLENFIKNHSKLPLTVNNNNEDYVHDDECPICFEPFKKTLECGHSFHHRCIDDWLKKNPTCPLCRRPVKMNNNNNNTNN